MYTATHVVTAELKAVGVSFHPVCRVRVTQEGPSEAESHLDAKKVFLPLGECLPPHRTKNTDTGGSREQQISN